MYRPDFDEQWGGTSPANQASPSNSGDIDRVNGEYHYKNGYTQKIYSDAHYVPADESAVPPRYYTPNVKERKVRREKRRRPWVAVLCLSLACLVFGLALGGAFVYGEFSERISALQDRIELAETEIELASQSPAPSVESPAPASSISSKPTKQIYATACMQTVGITTEVTYQNFFGQTSSSAVSGSGFIISEDGYIITNYHVIEYAHQYNYKISVMMHDGARYEASIVGVEKSNDIAVLKIAAQNLSAVTVADSDDIFVGDAVYAVGNPLGELEFTMTSGHVSALDRLIGTDASDSINMFQIDAAVNSGNSGGPVYNANGEVIGVVTAKYSSTGVEGLGFAIPINDAVNIASDLITKGYVTGKAYMGVSLDHRYTSMFSQYYGMPNGAYVNRVERGSCAYTAGIRPGDIITAIGDYPVESYNDVSQVMRNFSAGDSSTVSVYQSGEIRTLEIVFDEEVPENNAGTLQR